MSHYAHSIRRMGTADGYSTEGPERLHIDFAKVGYRASNCKQYTAQMALWLNRQESVHCYDTYLRWLGTCNEPADDVSAYDDNDDDDIRDPEIVTTWAGNVVEEEEDAVEDASYTIAKTPMFPQTSVKKLTEDYGAADFLSTLDTFLGTTVSHRQLRELPHLHEDTRIPVFKQFKITLPIISQVSKRQESDAVRAIPSVSAKGRPFEQTLAQFSTVLVRIHAGDRAQDGEGSSRRHVEAETAAGT